MSLFIIQFLPKQNVHNELWCYENQSSKFNCSIFKNNLTQMLRFYLNFTLRCSWFKKKKTDGGTRQLGRVGESSLSLLKCHTMKTRVTWWPAVTFTLKTWQPSAILGNTKDTYRPGHGCLSSRLARSCPISMSVFNS